jgi:hypothetical protein
VVSVQHGESLVELAEELKFAMSQQAIHIFLRLAGYDLGTRSRTYFGRQCELYRKQRWWKEYLDMHTVLSDLTVEMKQPKDFVKHTYHYLADSLMVGEMYEAAAGMY